MPTSTSIATSPQLQSLFLDLIPEFIGPIIPSKILKLRKPRGKRKNKKWFSLQIESQIEIQYDFDPRDEEATIPDDPWEGLPLSKDLNWKDAECILHDALLVRSLHTLMDGRCSQTIRNEIMQWLNAPIILPEEMTPEIIAILPFSYQACCEFAGVDAIELLEMLEMNLKRNGLNHDFPILREFYSLPPTGCII